MELLKVTLLVVLLSQIQSFSVVSGPTRVPRRNQGALPVSSLPLHEPLAVSDELIQPWKSSVAELHNLEQLAIREAAAEVGLVAAFPTTSAVVEECAITDRPDTSLLLFDESPTVSTRPPSISPLDDRTKRTTSLEGGDLMCRVVAVSDGKLDSNRLPKTMFGEPQTLRRLDDIYHAHSYNETRGLSYMSRKEEEKNLMLEREGVEKLETEEEVPSLVKGEEETLVSVLKTSLEESGYQLMSRRDLDLCEALNAGYLLRLSILPDVADQDSSIAKEFYPEYFDEEGNVIDEKALSEKLLFDGRVLVYWRGYSKEVSKGRLLLPKLDYLQASIVQRFSGKLKQKLDQFERFVSISSLALYRKCTACYLHYVRSIADRITNKKISKRLRKSFRSPFLYSAYKALNNGRLATVSEMRASRADRFSFARYGGSKKRFVGSPNPMDALNPFVICEKGDGNCCSEGESRASKVDSDMYESLNKDQVRCPYDAQKPGTVRSAQLLERVGISNLIDIYSREGRRGLFETFFSESKLVEPTYDEVVVVWRPLPKDHAEKTKPKIVPPKIVYELADMFDIDGLPEIQEPVEPKKLPLEIRRFSGVPMANLPAVLPKTKLIFRPADAFVFDLVTIVNILAIAGSIKFDSPKLDLLALVSVTLFTIRTFLRYNNKLARYDLLVKTFLTSKISHRNAGALKYLVAEAGSQRASRTALVHTWLKDKSVQNDGTLDRSALILNGDAEINAILGESKRTPIDVAAALDDLEELGLIKSSGPDGEHIDVVREDNAVLKRLRSAWSSLFDESTRFRTFLGRKKRAEL